MQYIYLKLETWAGGGGGGGGEKGRLDWRGFREGGRRRHKSEGVVRRGENNSIGGWRR